MVRTERQNNTMVAILIVVIFGFLYEPAITLVSYSLSSVSVTSSLPVLQ